MSTKLEPGLVQGRDKTDHLDRQQFVTFALGAQLYCIDIMSVREIRVSNTITALPGAPDYIRGVINLRGTIVPVCDLKARFGQPKAAINDSNAIVIASINGKLAGLLVDEVCDIVTAGASEISPIPDTDANGRNPFFLGIIAQENAMLIIVAPDRLMDNAVAQTLNAA